MHGTLIKELHNRCNQKMYKLDFKIYTSKYGTIKDIAENYNHLKEEWKFDGQTDYIDTVFNLRRFYSF